MLVVLIQKEHLNQILIEDNMDQKSQHSKKAFGFVLTLKEWNSFYLISEDIKGKCLHVRIFIRHSHI